MCYLPKMPSTSLKGWGDILVKIQWVREWVKKRNIYHTVLMRAHISKASADTCDTYQKCPPQVRTDSMSSQSSSGGGNTLSSINKRQPYKSDGANIVYY